MSENGPLILKWFEVFNQIDLVCMCLCASDGVAAIESSTKSNKIM